MANDFMVPWVEMIKPNVEVLEEGKLVVSQTPEDLHKNHNGDMHAAVIFSMLEMAGMGALTLFLGDNIKSSFVVLKDINIEYLARAQGKISFEAQLTEQQKTELMSAIEDKSAIEMQVVATGVDNEGEMVATARMTGVIKPKRDQE